MLTQATVIFGTLAGGWIIGNNPSSVFGVDVPVHLNFLTVAMVVTITVELFTAGIINSRRSRQQKEPTEPRQYNKWVVMVISGMFLAGLFITLFFGYLIMRNYMGLGG
jgi:uncharacterized membrane protein YidH (DUF202 family)